MQNQIMAIHHKIGPLPIYRYRIVKEESDTTGDRGKNEANTTGARKCFAGTQIVSKLKL